MPLEIGQILEDKYRIIRLVGQGGMGAVYEGENTRIRRRVAIKVLHSVAAENPELIARFEHEAQAAGQIGSDHILEVLDLGALPDGDRFMVMEFLDGEPLSSRIERLGRLPPQDAAGLLIQVLSGLAAAHRAGIVHRDLKPENVYILKEKAGQLDFVKIIDFGISKFQSTSTGPEMRMTRTGAVLGTPYYMSPEQASGKSIDSRSDVYSAGVILYEALSGSTPFEGTTYNELILKIVLSAPPPLSSLVPDLSPELCAIVERAMAREVEYRFQSAEEFGQALFGWAQAGGRAGGTMFLRDVAGVPRPSFGTPMPVDPRSISRSGLGTPMPADARSISRSGLGTPMPGPGRPSMPSQGQQGMWDNTPDPGLLASRGGAARPAGQLPSLSGSGVGSWGTTGAGHVAPKPKWGQWIAIAACSLAVLIGAIFGVVRLVRGPVSVATAETASTPGAPPGGSATGEGAQPAPSASSSPPNVFASPGPETQPTGEPSIFIPLHTPLPPDPRVSGLRGRPNDKHTVRPQPTGKNPGGAAPTAPTAAPPPPNTNPLGY